MYICTTHIDIYYNIKNVNTYLITITNMHNSKNEVNIFTRIAFANWLTTITFDGIIILVISIKANFAPDSVSIRRLNAIRQIDLYNEFPLICVFVYIKDPKLREISEVYERGYELESECWLLCMLCLWVGDSELDFYTINC